MLSADPGRASSKIESKRSSANRTPTWLVAPKGATSREQGDQSQLYKRISITGYRFLIIAYHLSFRLPSALCLNCETGQGSRVVVGTDGRGHEECDPDAVSCRRLLDKRPGNVWTRTLRTHSYCAIRKPTSSFLFHFAVFKLNARL